MTSSGDAPSEPQQDGRQLQKPSPRATGSDLLFCFCVLHHQDKQTQPGPGAPVHLSRTVVLSQPVRKPPRTPGEVCVMAEPWHSPCPCQHRELQESRTWAWSACCCQRWTKGKRGRVQFRLSWSTFLAGISAKLHLLWLFLPWCRGSCSWLCVHKEHTSPGNLPVPVPRETGTVPAWHTTSVQGASGRSHWTSQGHCYQVTDLWENDPNPSTENVSPPRAQPCDW